MLVGEAVCAVINTDAWALRRRRVIFLVRLWVMKIRQINGDALNWRGWWLRIEDYGKHDSLLGRLEGSHRRRTILGSGRLTMPVSVGNCNLLRLLSSLMYSSFHRAGNCWWRAFKCCQRLSLYFGFHYGQKSAEKKVPWCQFRQASNFF